MMAAMQTPGLRGELRHDEPLARYTSWRVGGPADQFYRPADIADLAGFLAASDASLPVVWIGLGSNVLVRDGGIRGIVIYTVGCINDIALTSPRLVRAEAGAASAKVARFCASHDLGGAEFLAGIPGSVGGALAMNAGAFGGETWNIVESVETVDRDGRLRRRTPADYRVAYRHVEGPADEWFVAATFRLQPVQGHEARARIRQLLDQRAATQPVGTANAGSVFTNPAGDHAARLIDASGLKGYCIGGACVSEKHANFIINTGSATARDIEELITHVRETVSQRQGVMLHPEVRVIGEVGA